MIESWRFALDCIVAVATVSWVLIGLLMSSRIDKLRLELSELKFDLTKNQMDTVGVVDTHISNTEIHLTELRRRLDNLENVRHRA